MRKISIFVLVCVLFFSSVGGRIAHASNDHLVISQVQITGGAGKTTNDFIEIFNPTASGIDLKGYRLVKRTQTGITDTLLKSWTDSAIVPAGGYYLWANSAFTDILVTADIVTTGSISDNNGVALRQGLNDTGTIIDSVAWGTASNSFIEGSVIPTNPTANQSLVRTQDTDNNLADFSILDSSPHNSSSVVSIPTPDPTPSPDPSPTPVPDPTPEPDPAPVGSVAPVFSQSVIISEFLPNPDGKDDGEEWIEFYNNSDQDVDLSQWLLDDEGGEIGKDAYVFPDGSAIKAKSYMVVNLSADNFALNNTGGDTVRLFWPDKTLFRTISYTTTAKDDFSYALMPSGLYDWTEVVSKGVANQFTSLVPTGISSVAQKEIKINEVFPDPQGPDSGGEWVEITNLSDQPIFLNNWILDDGGADDVIGTSAWKITDQTIYPKGFAVLTIPSGKFALNNTQDFVRLFNENKVLIDSVSYSGAKEDKSYSLIVGKWDWVSSTPNAENAIIETEKATEIILPKIVINELFPEPARKSSQEEFIELFNPTADAIDVTGYKISDLATSHNLEGWIEANGYLVIKKSENNISLNNSGSEIVTLTDAAGGVIDLVVYEDAPLEQSYNLMPDGTYVWSASLTPGKLNKISTVKTSDNTIQTASTATATTEDNSIVEEAVDLNNLSIAGEVSGANITPAQEIPRQSNTWPWIIGSFAVNMAFCYSLIKLMNGPAVKKDGIPPSTDIK